MSDTHVCCTDQSPPRARRDHERKKFWTDERRGRVRELYVAGKQDVEIAGDFGVTVGAIEEIRSALRLFRRAPPAWPPQKIDALIALWQLGHSASEIGKRLGVTKNSVIGMAHRMGLPKRKSPIIRKPAVIKTFTSLAPGQCQYPLGKLLEKSTEWCGEPVTRRSYCEKHYKVVYLPPSVKPAGKEFAVERKAHDQNANKN